MLGVLGGRGGGVGYETSEMEREKTVDREADLHYRSYNGTATKTEAAATIGREMRERE